MSDHVLRAMTDDGAFRVVVIDASDTAQAVINRQDVNGAVASVFGELLASAVLVREMMSPDQRVQGILQGSDPRTQLVADALPGGITRGLAQIRDKNLQQFPLAGGRLQMMRSLNNGSLQQGVVEVASGMSAALAEYMLTSEQIACVLQVQSQLPNQGARTMGFVVQLLPEITHVELSFITERLDQGMLGSSEGQGTPWIDCLLQQGPEAFVAALLHGVPYSVVATAPVQFGCICEEQRLLTSLASLPRADIEDLASGTEVLEIGCDYCGKQYQIAPERLRGLLDDN